MPFRAADIRGIYENDSVKLLPDALDYLVALANEPGNGALRRCDTIYLAAVTIERMVRGDESARIELCEAVLRRAEAEVMPDEGLRFSTRRAALREAATG